MVESKREKAILDACVLYPAPIRDILLNLADQGLFIPKWSKIIEEEWIRNLLLNRQDLQRSKLERTVKAMENAFPSSQVNGFEDIVNTLSLPDKNDNHVLAAAIKSDSSLIITFNLKDFPANELLTYGIKAMNPDDFIIELIEKDEAKVNQGFSNQLQSLRNPPKTREELLETLRKCGLKKFYDIMKK